ncbi:hypothetical protein [Streptomyces solicathayae]|uniref:Knr4/Smi1-like domain-containing protein n=1 Tax=Streptomyces solicathayae TaxID=3081768 RepID=A0ABZ0LWP4_9ACTN|nr:hypothetical protein [Streptomyces sp. HUAS YS2]WOX23745.1 hypothetical protein R2D22_21095 [Streptomyces sp. HUAS YS2]
MSSDVHRLIEGLRSRAHDPARRRDEVAVPLEWLEGMYGADVVDRALFLSYLDDGLVAYLPSGAEEASAYYADASRGPLHPPVPVAEWEQAEAAIGRRLPELLRRVYTEVGDGGFGPDYGLHPLAELVEIHRKEREAGDLPPTWLQLVACGCATAWYVALDEAAESPVVRYEDDGRGFDRGIVHTTLPLHAWLHAWTVSE